MLVPVLLLLLGFFLLYKGAGLLVDGSSALAKQLKISAGLIGLTVVAFGTSMPDFFINFLSNTYQVPDLGTGAIIGANISLVLLSVGVCAIIYPISVKKELIRKELPLPIFALLLLILLANNFFLGGMNFLSRIDGVILLIFFFAFLYYTIGKAKLEKHTLPRHEEKISHSIIYIIIGVVSLIIGGVLTIFSSMQISGLLGLAGSTIGLTIIALGTTLPELFTSINAAIKKNAELAVGNIVGSILFNILFILGISSLINPLPFQFRFNTELIISLTSVLLIYYFTLNDHRERKIQRWEGVLLVALYVFYVGYVIYK